MDKFDMLFQIDNSCLNTDNSNGNFNEKEKKRGYIIGDRLYK